MRFTSWPQVSAWFASPLAQQAAQSAALIAGLVVLHRLIRFYVARSVSDPLVRQRYWELSRNVLVMAGVVLVLGVWLEELKAFALVLTGVLAAFLIANKEVLLSLVGRINLSITEHYRIGDRIQINGVSGDVIGIGILYTWLIEVTGEHGHQSSTGRIITVPHIWLTLHSVFNSTHFHDYLWEELELVLPLSEDLVRVMDEITAAATELLAEDIERAARSVREFTRHYGAKTAPVTPVCYLKLHRTVTDESCALITLRYIARAREVRSVRSRLTIQLLAMLKREGVSLLLPKENANGLPV